MSVVDDDSFSGDVNLSCNVCNSVRLVQVPTDDKCVFLPSAFEFENEIGIYRTQHLPAQDSMSNIHAYMKVLCDEIRQTHSNQVNKQAPKHLNLWSKFLFKKLIFSHRSKNFPNFVEPKDSMACSNTSLPRVPVLGQTNPVSTCTRSSSASLPTVVNFMFR